MNYSVNKFHPNIYDIVINLNIILCHDVYVLLNLSYTDDIKEFLALNEHAITNLKINSPGDLPSMDFEHTNLKVRKLLIPL